MVLIAATSLSNKMDRVTVSMYQKIYRALAQTIRALNTLTTAHQATLGHGPAIRLWCPCLIGLAAAGDQSVCLNLPRLSDREKQLIIDAEFNLFGHAIDTIKQASDLSKKEVSPTNPIPVHRMLLSSAL